MARAADAEPTTSGASTASEQAAASGEAVEVVGAREEYATTHANPDGYTFTLTQSAVPVRVARPDGSWAEPDATLRRRADGSIGPKASVADISLSAGGDGAGPVKLAEGGRSLSLGRPGGLPEPGVGRRVRHVIDNAAQAITKRYSTPFGADRGQPTYGPWPDDKGFLGASGDSSSGLTHVGAREYDPLTGRFVSVDPVLNVAEHQSLNGYTYGNNSPVTLSDPAGLDPCGGLKCGHEGDKCSDAGVYCYGAKSDGTADTTGVVPSGGGGTAESRLPSGLVRLSGGGPTAGSSHC